MGMWAWAFLLFLLLCFKTTFCKFCDGPTEYSLCDDMIEKANRLKCRGQLLNDYLSDDYASKVKTLGLCQMPGPTFDVGLISKFPRLNKFSLTFSYIAYLDIFPTHNYLQVLNLTNLQLEIIEPRQFNGLSVLKILDLSHNHLKYLDHQSIMPLSSLRQLYLKSNPWFCKADLRWLLTLMDESSPVRLMDINKTVCSEDLYPGKPFLSIMGFLRITHTQCPVLKEGVCKCSLDNVVWSPSRQYLVPFITVNCSHLHLKTLPRKLPQNTTILLLNGNSISDLSPLINNPDYKGVSDIYLDYNQITSIDALESADWLLKFRVLSLRHNHLQTIPVYAMDNALGKNGQAAKLYFGGNPWICDCYFTPRFKELLLKYDSIIEDNNEIYCFEPYSRPTDKKLVHHLSLSSICNEESGLLTLLDCLNITLALLIALIITKLFYDYWVFKSTGHLPWIVNKIF